MEVDKSNIPLSLMGAASEAGSDADAGVSACQAVHCMQPVTSWDSVSTDSQSSIAIAEASSADDDLQQTFSACSDFVELSAFTNFVTACEQVHVLCDPVSDSGLVNCPSDGQSVCKTNNVFGLPAVHDCIVNSILGAECSCDTDDDMSDNTCTCAGTNSSLAIGSLPKQSGHSLSETSSDETLKLPTVKWTPTDNELSSDTLRLLSEQNPPFMVDLVEFLEVKYQENNTGKSSEVSDSECALEGGGASSNCGGHHDSTVTEGNHSQESNPSSCPSSKGTLKKMNFRIYY